MLRFLSWVSVRDLFWVDFKFCLSSDDADLDRIQLELFLKRSPKWQIYQTLSVLDGYLKEMTIYVYAYVYRRLDDVTSPSKQTLSNQTHNHICDVLG